ncbi:MAG: sulfotransferase [Cryomorphaceae bacterium]
MINFIGIGAQKAGTSWLHQALGENPHIALLPIKEVHYFDRSNKYPSPSHLDRTLSERFRSARWVKMAVLGMWNGFKHGGLRRLIWMVKWYTADYHDAWYLSLFQNNERVQGEITPSYAILDEADIQKMHRLAPDARILFMIRNPIDRAWSQYRYYTRLIPDYDASNDSPESIIEFMQRPTQELRSDYLSTMRKFAGVFDASQVLIGFYDAIYESPSELLADVTKHIGAESSPVQNARLKNVVNRSQPMNCPEEVRAYLRDRYRSPMKELAERVGGYCGRWYYDEFGDEIGAQKSTASPSLVLSEIEL